MRNILGASAACVVAVALAVSCVSSGFQNAEAQANAQEGFVEEMNGWKVVSANENIVAEKRPLGDNSGPRFTIGCYVESNNPPVWWAAIDGISDYTPVGEAIGRSVARENDESDSIYIWMNGSERRKFYVFGEGRAENTIMLLFPTDVMGANDKAAFSQAGKDAVKLFTKLQSLSLRDNDGNTFLTYDLQRIDEAYRSLLSRGCR